MTTVTVEAAGIQRRPARAKSRGGIRLFEWLTDNAIFKTFILICILINSALLGYDAHFGGANPYHDQIQYADDIFLLIFTCELALEFLAQGPRRYFRDGWNLFDCAIVLLSYMSAIPGITALRTLRILRVLRLVSNVPQMRRVIEALIGAMPGIMATVMVLCVVFYIGAVMGTTLFHQEEGFRNLGESALTLFQLTQFDGWGDMITRLDARYPYAWVFIMGFTVIAAFAVLNLFIGVIVDAVQETRSAETKAMAEDVSQIEEGVEDIADAQEDSAAIQKRILEELTALRAEVSGLRQQTPPSA
jgi:voltage-gated sodium channel